MKHVSTLLSLMALGFLLAAPIAEAQPRADPFHFGLGALASWTRDAGNPAASDSNQEGLYLQKATLTANFAAAGASILPLPAPAIAPANLTDLSFEISGFPGAFGEPFAGGDFGPSHGYCGAGAPRFNVTSTTGGTCFLGCAAGDKTHLASGWWKVNFTFPFTQYAGCAAISGVITNIDIIFDEGIDQGPGNVVLDNITIKRKNPIAIYAIGNH